MFEKEAEEYLFDRLDPKAIDSVSEFSNKHIEEAIVSSFKDGAEFGYNKANEWHEYSERPKEKINALCFDISQNKFILGFYDLEADEWLRYGGYETININLWTKIEIPEFIKE